MGFSLEEYLTAQFYAWEKRGRGWAVFTQPVHLEPEFIPFFGHFAPTAERRIDYGLRPRFFPKLQERLGLTAKPGSAPYDEESLQQLEEIFEVTAFVNDDHDSYIELELHFSKDTRIVFEHVEQLLLMVASFEGTIGFEIVGRGDRVSIQFVCSRKNVEPAKAFVKNYVPGVVIHEKGRSLFYDFQEDASIYVIDVGLEDEFMRPIKVWNKFDPDPLAGLIAYLETINDNEEGVLQVLFQKTRHPWAESIFRSVTDSNGATFFKNAPEMLPLAKEKISSPLFGAIIRVVGKASSPERAHQIALNLNQSLTVFSRTGSNSLMPLAGPASYDLEDILQLKSRRVGMILNSYELASIVHIPDRSILSPKLRVYVGKTKKAPKDVMGHPFKLGENIHLGHETTVTVSDEHRLRHMHIIGATGTGKSTLLLNLITQDIAQGRGLTVLDPHGDLIDQVIQHAPEERLNDVVLVDPSDSEYPIGLNLLSAHSDAEKVILSSDMVALFRRFATSWGDQMTSVLANAIDAILDSKTGGTLIDLRRFLIEPIFRNKFLRSVDNPNILYYWHNEFQLLPKSTVGPILTRLDTFLRPRIVRNMMAQKDGLNVGDILNTQKILLVKLAQGLIGEDNSYLLGTLIVAKLHQAAQARQNLPPEKRTPFYFYIDEFQNFITPSMSAILSGARKYGLGLILAHQDLDQLARRDAELAGSVLANPAIRVCFRCGDKDAVKLESGFSYFDSTDLQSLGIGQAIARVGGKDQDFTLSFSRLPNIDPAVANEKSRKVVDQVRSKYATHHSQVEDIVRDALQIEVPVFKPTEEKKSPPEKLPEPIKQEKEKTKIEGVLKAEAEQFVEREVGREKQREHRFIQEFVKKVAEERNFKAVIEEPVNDGAGKVDVGLHRDELKIACEISVTNTVEYEVQNIEKCLTAGYQLVFMISTDREHLHAIRSQAVSVIDQSLHSRIHFVSKEEFVSLLDLLLLQQSQPEEIRAKGYRVKINYTGSQDAAGQQKALKDVILSSMRRRKEVE